MEKSNVLSSFSGLKDKNTLIMEINLFSLYFGLYDCYGFELLNFCLDNKDRGVLCITWSPSVAIWIDILFFKIHIEL